MTSRKELLALGIVGSINTVSFWYFAHLGLAVLNMVIAIVSFAAMIVGNLRETREAAKAGCPADGIR
jgi:hypothetical protein